MAGKPQTVAVLGEAFYGSYHRRELSDGERLHPLLDFRLDLYRPHDINNDIRRPARPSDRSGACSLEAGLGYYCRWFGYHYPRPVLERIVRLLESPGTLPADPDYEARSETSLSYLRGRAPGLWERLAALRDRTAGEA